MKVVAVSLILLCLSVASLAQRITVFENAPFIDASEVQQMRNFAEWGDSYFYTSLSFPTNSEGDNVLVRVNKNTGMLMSNDQKRLSIVGAWLAPTEKYIYYPNFESISGSLVYTLKRFDPTANTHETMKNEKGQDALFTSSFLRLAGLHSYKNSVVTTGTTEGLQAMPYSKFSSNQILDSTKFLANTSISYSQGPNHLFYTATVPTANTLTINDEGLFFFAKNHVAGTYDLRFIRAGETSQKFYSFGDVDSYLPFVTSNDKLAFAVAYEKKDLKGEMVKVSLIQFAETKQSNVAFFNIDRLSLDQDIQLAVFGDSVYVSDRWNMYEYNFKLKTVKQHLKLTPKERLYNVQNGKRFHFAPDGTIFYKKMTYTDRDEMMGNAFVFALDKAKSTSKSLFETTGSRNGDDLTKMHNARNNTYFIGSKAVDFKLNAQADKLDVLVYGKDGTVTNVAMPQIKKFMPSTSWYGKQFTAVQTKDSVVFNYGHRKDKKVEKIVVMKLSE